MWITMHRRSGWTALVLVALVAGAACDDGLGPDRDPIPGTGELYALSRVDNLGLPAAYDLTPNVPLPVKFEDEGATGQWDVALAETDGRLVLAPASSYEGQGNAVIAMDTANAFADLTEAPEDTSAYKRTPVDVRSDAVYVVRSRRVSSCVFFSKLQPLEIDEEEGRLRFEYLLNANCNARSFVPTEDD